MRRKKGGSDRSGYQVGYRKPPMASRFKPGQSGNPRGRPKGLRPAKDILREILSEKISVKLGNTVVRMTKQDALYYNAVNKAMTSDMRFTRMILELSEKLGLNEQKKEDRMVIEFVYGAPKRED